MTEQPPVRETERYRPYTALQSRMLLAASDLPKNINVINPANKSVTPFTKEQLSDFGKHDYSLFDHASTNERKKTAGVKREELDQKVTEWAASCANLVKGDVRGKKFFGDDYQNTTTEDMVKFYHTYFTGNDKRSDLKLFVKDAIAEYTSDGKIRTEDLLKDLPDIQWLAHVFGSNSSEIVTQLIDAEIMLQTYPDTLVKIGNQNINGFIQESDDERLLTFLWDNRITPQPPLPRPLPPSSQPPTPQPQPTSPQPPTPPTEPPRPLEGNRTYTLFDIFRMVSDPVPTDHEFYMENPPEGITLTPQQMESLKTREPFFIAWPGGWAANPKVIPWDKFKDDPRFNHVEDLTQRDSGTVALAAVSAPDAEKQVTLYKTMVKTILSFHEQNPRFLEEWMNAQQNEIPNLDPAIKQQFIGAGFINASPASIFANYDILRLADKQDHNQLLVPISKQHKVETSMLPAIWNPRIQELKKLFAQPNPQLQPHHLRWVEFLSHSVDSTKLVEMIKSQQP